jgi:hypothetical protein
MGSGQDCIIGVIQKLMDFSTREYCVILVLEALCALLFRCCLPLLQQQQHWNIREGGYQSCVCTLLRAVM